MTQDEIVQAGWPIIQRYYEGSSDRYYCNAYVRDLMWDTAVDVLFSTSRHYDGRVPLAAFIQWALRRAWRQLVYKRKPLERMVVETLVAISGGQLEPIESQEASNYQDQVDGADLMELTDRLEPENRVALLGVLDGRLLKDVSAELGLTRQTVRARSEAAIRDLKQMVGEEAA